MSDIELLLQKINQVQETSQSNKENLEKQISLMIDLMKDEREQFRVNTKEYLYEIKSSLNSNIENLEITMKEHIERIQEKNDMNHEKLIEKISEVEHENNLRYEILEKDNKENTVFRKTIVALSALSAFGATIFTLVEYYNKIN